MPADAAAFPPRLRSRNPLVAWRDHRRLAGLERTVDRLLVPPPQRAWGAFGRSHVVPPCRITTPERIFVGDGVVVHEHCWFSVVRHFPDIEPALRIGNRVRIGRCCQFAVAGEVVVEDDVIIGDFAQIGDTVHPYEAQDRWAELSRPLPVRIGRGAVIGGHAVVLPGVTIGAGAYVEHHAWVNRDVDPGEIVMGVPARPVA